MTLFLRDERPNPAGKRLKVNASSVEDSFVRMDDEDYIEFSLDRSDPCAFGTTVQIAESCEISGPLCTVQPMETCETLSPAIPPAPSSAGLRYQPWNSSVVRYEGHGEYCIPCGCEIPKEDTRDLFCWDHSQFFCRNEEFVGSHQFCSPHEIFEVFPPVPPPAPSSAGLLRQDWRSSVLMCDDDGYYIDLTCVYVEEEDEDVDCPRSCQFHRQFYLSNDDFYEEEDFDCEYTQCWEVSKPVPMTREVFDPFNDMRLFERRAALMKPFYHNPRH